MARMSIATVAAMVVAGSILAAPLETQAAIDEIGLTLDNPLPFARTAEPVTCGVPLVRGFCKGASDLAVLDAKGRPVPAQVLVTARYKDGSPRWVLLDFPVALPAKGKGTYRLSRKVTPAAVEARLTYTLTNGVAEIDTGVAQFRVNPKRFRLFDSVRVGDVALVNGDGNGVTLVDEKGAKHTIDRPATSAEFEDAGPMRVVLAVRGELGPKIGKWPLAKYVCRMHFYAGKAEVRVFFTLHNPAAQVHPGNIWDLGSGGSVFAEDVSLVVPVSGLEGGTARVGVEVDRPAVGVSGAVAKLYQDSSGGKNWRSANHIDKDYKVRTSFRGYRVYGGEKQVVEGHRADGWLAVRGKRGGVAVGVRDFWQNFPKALEVSGGRLRIGLWPGEFAGVHEILGGEQKTHEILFVFHGPDAESEAVERRMKAFQRPLYAMPDPEAVIASGAFWPTAPLNRERYKLLEETCDTFVHPIGRRATSVILKWEQIDEFGWRHFGDTFADNESAPAQVVKDHPEHHFGRQPISHYGNEYDVTYGVMLQGLRRADPKWMWMTDVLARHYADICVYHTDAEGSGAYGHGPFMHTTHDIAAFRSTHRMYPIEGKRYRVQYGAGGGPNAGHCYVASLAQHYHLTGDRNSREAFLEVAGWALNSPWFKRPMMGDKRGIGNFLMTHLYAYQLTGEKKYYDAAMTVVGWAKKPFTGLAGTLFVKGAGRFLDMKAERDELDDDYRTVRDTMFTFGDLYLTLTPKSWERYLEQRCFHAQVLFTCWLYAPKGHPNREAYYAKGKSIMENARWPGTYKSTKGLIMCFGNTGAYQRAEWLRERGQK